jgi:hypothetical protein
VIAIPGKRTNTRCEKSISVSEAAREFLHEYKDGLRNNGIQAYSLADALDHLLYLLINRQTEVMDTLPGFEKIGRKIKKINPLDEIYMSTKEDREAAKATFLKRAEKDISVS